MSVPTGVHRGFTLLELIVAVALTAALVLIGVELSRMVARTGESLTRTQADWTAEQFLIGQVREIDPLLWRNAAYFSGEPNRLSFVSSRSARYGIGGPPVLVTYTIEPGRSIHYSEVALPPWWSDQPRLRPPLDRLREASGPDVWRDVWRTGVESARFEYWDPERQRWADRWRSTTGFPRAIRLVMRQIDGERSLVLETPASFFSSFFGS